jgi:hypothetical protein
MTIVACAAAREGFGPPSGDATQQGPRSLGARNPRTCNERRAGCSLTVRCLKRHRRLTPTYSPRARLCPTCKPTFVLS